MSTNKTPNYTLHSWVPGDNFLLNEINENFSAVDSAIAASVSGWTARAEALENAAVRVVAGSYVGTDVSDSSAVCKISLGFTPIAVLVTSQTGTTWSNGIYGGLAVTDHPAMSNTNQFLRIVEGGFEVSDCCSSIIHINEGTKHYLALG